MAPNKIKDTLKNKKLTAALVTLAEETGLETKEGRANLTKANGSLLYSLGAAYNKGTFPHHLKVATYILDGKLTSGARIDGALKYVTSLSQDAAWDAAAFEKASGVGVEVTEDNVRAVVLEILKTEAEALETEGTRCTGRLMKTLSTHPDLVFADRKMCKTVFDAEIKKLNLKTPAPAAGKGKGGKGKGKGKEKPKEKEGEGVYETLPDSVEYPPPEANKQLRAELLEENLAFLKKIGANVVTRFPPEPNGYLHIGHAKSMNLNFGYAKRKGGVCYLRFDDTNPASEKQEYIDSIIGSVKWLGHEPWTAPTYSSDYFPQLFEHGVTLVKKNYGYICECKKPEIKKNRDDKKECGCRSRSVEENLKLFLEMKDGKHAPGSMTMRMKADMSSPDTAMRDMIAYRIIFDPPHPRTGNTWKIYPSYDFTHCICDSIENITHSLCTTEFCTRRPAYEWVCEKLDIYVPPQREFGRMCIEGTVLSKRKLLLLVNNKCVSGWDDPRLLTLDGLKRRGYTPEAINHFCKSLSVTRNEGASTSIRELERHCIKVMDRDAKRLMVVLRPLKITISNFGESKEVSVPCHPKRPEMGTHTIHTSKVCYIERDDFREEDLAGYKRLSPSNIVRLRHGPTIKLVEVKKEGDAIVELIVEAVEEPKPSGTIHWVGEEGMVETEVRLYSNLFKSANPSALDHHSPEFLADVNPDSLEVIPGALVEKSCLAGCVPGFGAQFERVGYFTVDYDTKEGGKVVWNRTVPLREDKAKV
jgi:glutaminyl-tRNA synthetase